MKLNHLTQLSVIATLFSGLLFTSIPTAQAASSPVILGYYTPDQASDESLNTNYSYITHMSTDSFNFNSQGVIVGTVPTQAVSFAKSKNIATYACISNYGTNDFDPAVAHAVLTNSTVKNKAISNLVTLVKNNGYKGVNFDFESVLKTDRNALSSFIRDLANTLRPLGYQTLISVPAKIVDDPNDDWAGAFDYASLGQNVDYMQVMTYDQNGPWSSPGPVAGKDWIDQSLQFSVSTVAPAKVLMGLPAYGYDWNLTTNNANDDTQVPWKEIPNLISRTHATTQWDAASSSPYLTYKATDGSNHVVWYENIRSITEKSSLYTKYHLAGISMWSMGLEDTSFWQAIHSAGPTPNAPTIPGKIEAENYSAMQGVVNETTTDTGGGLDVGYIDPGDWMDYNVNVQTPGTYKMEFRVASAVTGGKFQIKNDAGAILATINIPKTGGYQTWQTVSTNITLPIGDQKLRVFLASGEPNLNWIHFTK